MYKNIFFDSFNKDIHLWDDLEGYSKFKYKEYAYTPDPNGQFTSIDGHKVKKITEWSDQALQMGMIYEANVPAATRTLVDLYYESDELSHGLVVLPIDIEVAKEGSYSSTADANNTITSISYYSYKENLYYCLLLDKNRTPSEYNDIVTIKLPEKGEKKVNAKYFTFNSEFDLLKVFLREYNLIKPDVITGWNCLSENSTVWLPDRISRIQNIQDGDILFDNVLVNKSAFTGNKPQYELLDKFGNILYGSENHIIPTYCVPTNKHINITTIKNYYKELTIGEIKNLLGNNNIYTIQQIGNNINDNLVYKDLLINNFDLYCKYDYFDFKLDDNIFREYIKYNPTDYFDSKDMSPNSKFSNKWRFKHCGHLFPRQLILDFIKKSKSITFIFGSNKSVKINIDDIISCDIIQLMGMLFTDGTYNNYDKHYSYCNKELDLMEAYCNILNIESLKDVARGKFKLKTQDNCYYQSFGLNNKFRLLHPFIYHNTKKKNLNIELLSQLSQKQFFAFMSGVIDGDGSVNDCINICNFNNHIEYNIRIFIELLRWNGIITNSTCKSTVRIKSLHKNKPLFENLRLFHTQKSQNLNNIKYFNNMNSSNNKSNWFIDGDLLYIKLKGVQNTNHVVPMYDLNTSTHFFISNGIKVHNCEFYDIPYLYNRICKVLGKDWANGLSPIKICKAKPAGDFNQLKVSIAGVSVLDYLMLYKKFTYSESPNYKLDTISKAELGRGKIEYDGDLQKLYETNIKKFAEYNIVDVELIVAMDAKLNLIDIARGICHKGHVPYEDYIYPSRYLDGAALIYCKRNDLVASTNRAEGKEIEDESAEGAFVKEPTPGLYKWVIDLDLESLYPSNIRTLNISPETKYGRIKNYTEADFVKNVVRKYELELIKDKTPIGKFSDEGFKSNKKYFNTTDELRTYIEKNNLSISSNGILYTLDKPGLLPSILSGWFGERKQYQKLMKQYQMEGKEDLVQLYDKKQLVTKILLNSFYGVLLLKTFRFYDKENGEAVTSTGRSIINFTINLINQYINQKLK